MRSKIPWPSSPAPLLSSLVLGLLLSSCSPEDEPLPTPNPLEAVPASVEWNLPCLTAPVHVVRTEHDIPHIYGESRADVACAQGFVTARDRFFQMDLIARNGLGTLGEILGEQGFDTDIEIVSRGGRFIADQMLESASSADRAIWQAYADGVNAYIDRVRSGEFPVPAELDVLYLFLGVESAADLLYDWTPRTLAGVASTVNYVSGFETDDIGNQATVEALENYGDGMTNSELRHDGAILDIWENIAPVYPRASAPDFPSQQSSARSNGGLGRRQTMKSGPKVERGVLERAVAAAESMHTRIGRTGEPGFGSNAWAIAPSRSADGVALLGSDGHLALTVPGYLYNTHLDTELLGGGDTHVLGLTIAGAPMIGLGTNGNVAWGHTSQVSDINDYYRDVVVLGEDGKPAATRFQGEDVAVQEVVETYEVSGALGGTAGTRTISRWVTGQGRPFFSLEGTVVDGPDDNPAAVNVFGQWIVAGDVDGVDGITAVTAAATHYSERYMVQHIHGWATSKNVDEWGTHLAGMTSYSQHFLAADTSGNILYAGFQGMPCRSYLPRDAEGVPEAGANPQLLINGEEFPSFEVTYDDDLRIDPRADSEIHCTVAYEDYPHSKNPEQGFVFNSNNAPWDAAWDNNLWNDDRYIGGPWYGTWRGSRIAGLIEESDQHSVETVASIQGDHKSRMATEFLPTLLEALSTAQAYATDGELNGAAGRIAALYSDNQTAIDEAWGRLQTWQSRGLDAASGVATFYNEPSQEEQDDAVATMIFNAWFGRFVNGVFNDEGLPSVFQPTGSYGRTRALKNLIDGIGTDNPTGLASWDASTGESVFFDDAGTEDVETKDEIAVSAFVEALDYLATPFGSDRSGGFNTTDQSQWLWGLKHFVYFDNFFAREIGDDLIDALFADLGISPEHLPLDDPEPGFGDVRMGLPGFPRPGDAFAVDAAGGFTTQSYGYGSGPVMRMSLAMDPSGIHGVNVIPGGQSSHPTDPFFSDQAALWLANEASPVRFYVADVVANATGREVLSP